MRAPALSRGIALALPLVAAAVLSLGGSAAAQDSRGSQGCGGLVCDLGLFGTHKEPPAAPAAPAITPPPASAQPVATREDPAEPVAREHHPRDRRAARHVPKPATRAARHQPLAAPKTAASRAAEARPKPEVSKPEVSKREALGRKALGRETAPRAVASRPSPASRAASHGTTDADLPLPPGMEAVSNGQALPAPPAPAPPPPPQAPVVLANPYVTQSAPTQFQPVDPFYHGEP